MPFSRSILLPRFISTNILNYITDETRQQEALEAVGAVNFKPLKSLAQRREEQRRTTDQVPMYPAIAFDNDNDAQDYGDDLINGEYVTTFRMVIQHEDDLLAVEQAIYYEAAVQLMLINCPTSTLFAGVGTNVVGNVQNVRTGFLGIQAGQDGTAENDFYQVVEIQPVITLVGSAHS